ncbi:hypothetical protein PHYBOEH_001524 [Phytophthora boehmeriae]|uniref:Uncharacterized protein n=1 Tax=Phytophthora boehmeriae TaxID=109152 RepID=A0A8T1WYX3_9STRA|nr:hypothetical protein PHYBOEH_001524 [Phytophthora boehmeriae]
MRARKEVAACENLKRELLRSQQVLADLETQRFMFVRNRGKSVKWGGAKKAAEEQLARLDAAIASSKSDSILHEQELHSRQIALEKLQDDATHGRSHGMGKGHGHDDNQRNKLAVVAAV